MTEEPKRIDKLLTLVEKISDNQGIFDKKLDNIFTHVENLEGDVKDLSIEVKSLHSKFADISKEVGKLETEIQHGKEERNELKADMKSLWKYLHPMKEGLKTDLKEFCRIITDKEINKFKAGMLVSFTAALIAIITAIIK